MNSFIQFFKLTFVDIDVSFLDDTIDEPSPGVVSEQPDVVEVPGISDIGVHVFVVLKT